MDADKAYTSVANFEATAAHGGTLYEPFKSNMKGAAGGIFEKMFYQFMYGREEYLQHYHKQSNVESVFSSIKRKFGDSVRSKTDTAMTNEALCKILCYNVCCCISAWYELGIDPEFGPEETGEEGVGGLGRRPGRRPTDDPGVALAPCGASDDYPCPGLWVGHVQPGRGGRAATWALTH